VQVGSAKAGAARPAMAIVATNKAAATNKLMRLITLTLSLYHIHPTVYVSSRIS